MTTKESSVVFSLKELEAMEKARIAEEQAALKAAEEQARAEEMAAAAEYETRLAEAEKVAYDEEQRAKAQFEAVIQAEVERARLEVEHRNRMAVLDAELNHKEHVVALKTDATKERFKKATVGLSMLLGFVVVLGGYGLYVWSQTSYENVNIAFQLQRARAEVVRLTGELDSKDRQIRDLENDLNSALDDRVLSRPKNDAPPQLKSNGIASGRNWGVMPKKPCAPCPPGDPLCPCL